MGTSPEVYEFGAFVLDVGERRLLRSGSAVSLSPKAYDLLVALVRRAGTLVLKRDLLDLVWPDASVEEGILAVHVSALRRVLTTAEGNGCIETVPRAGYRFGAAVRRRTVPSPLPQGPPAGVWPAHPAVSELIGRARTHLLAASRSDVPKAVEAFRAAIELDPHYAAGHAGMALACCARAEMRLASPARAYSDARDAALRALAMDPGNADAQVALGTVLFLSDWNWSGAQRCLERALEIDPDHAEGWLLYGRLLEALGRLAEGLRAKQKALERNPASAAVHLQIALSFWNQRQYDEMIEWARRSLALDPEHVLAHEFIAAAYLMKGDVDRHMRESFEHARVAGAPRELIEQLQTVYASSGRPGIVRYVLSTHGNAPPVQLALLHAEAGDLDEAFRHLDAAIASRDPALVHLAVAPQWDWLRADPRLAERLRAMGLRELESERAGRTGRF